MKNKLTGVLATALAVTMILPTGAKAFSESKTTVVIGEEVASQELKKIAAEKAELRLFLPFLLLSSVIITPYPLMCGMLGKETCCL